MEVVLLEGAWNIGAGIYKSIKVSRALIVCTHSCEDWIEPTSPPLMCMSMCSCFPRKRGRSKRRTGRRVSFLVA